MLFVGLDSDGTTAPEPRGSHLVRCKWGGSIDRFRAKHRVPRAPSLELPPP
jgi:hypothetical protein